MSNVRRYKFDTLTAIAAGTASGTKGPVRGEILGFYVNYSASSAAGTDLTITGPHGQGNLLNLVNNKTDGFFPVRATAVTNANADLTYDGSNKVVVPYPVVGILSAAVAQNTEGETVDIEVLVRE